MCSLDEKRRQFVSGSPQACKNTEQEDAEDLPSCSNSPQDLRVFFQSGGYTSLECC